MKNATKENSSDKEKNVMSDASLFTRDEGIRGCATMASSNLARQPKQRERSSQPSRRGQERPVAAAFQPPKSNRFSKSRCTTLQ